MSVKLLKLQWRIFFWTITGRIKKIHSRLELSLTKGNHKNILIVFPMDEPTFRVALYAFRELGQNDLQKNRFKYIVKEQFRDMFHLHTGTPVFIQNSEHENMLSDEKQLLQTLKNTQYHIIIDLNSTFHLGISRLISILKSEMKVGFRSRFSDRFYNIQLDISRSGIMEKGFKQINTMLAQ